MRLLVSFGAKILIDNKLVDYHESPLSGYAFTALLFLPSILTAIIGSLLTSLSGKKGVQHVRQSYRMYASCSAMHLRLPKTL